MARGVNKVIAMGNLGADPDTRYMPSGVACTTFSLGCTEGWKDKQTGEMKEHTEWMRCETWGRTAEIAAEYLRKGSQVYVEGMLRTDEWEKDGVKRYTTKVRVSNMQLLGKASADRREQKPAEPAPQDEFDDDIPF